VTALDCRDDDAQIACSTLRNWVKGCSSLGLWRCAALVDVVGQGSAAAIRWLDIKEAVARSRQRAERSSCPRTQESVGWRAHALSPSLGKRMLSGKLPVTRFSSASSCPKI